MLVVAVVLTLLLVKLLLSNQDSKSTKNRVVGGEMVKNGEKREK